MQYTLERHLKYECGVAKQFTCAVCLKKFSRRDILRTHEKKCNQSSVFNNLNHGLQFQNHLSINYNN